MRSRFFVRFQVILLVVLALLLVGRALRGPSVPDALVAWTDLEAGRFYEAALLAEGPARLAIDATGSFETVGGEDLAAHMWIIDAESRALVWTMDGTAAHRRGTLAAATDTLDVDAGTYAVYFAGYGSQVPFGRGNSVLERLFNPDASWPNDASSWRVVVEEVGGEVVRATSTAPAATAQPGSLLWRSPARSRGGSSFVFEVAEASVVRVRSTGEGDPATRAMRDYARIEEALGGETVWEMAWTSTQPAGGSPINRAFDGTVALEPGLYRARFLADGSHYDGRWSANPPFDPAAWGAALFAEAGTITPLKLWGTRGPLVDMTRLRDDAEIQATITLAEPATVAIAAMGEVSEGGTLYDYSWLEDASGALVWELSREASVPAGGASKNRAETALLRLEAGSYTLRAETDGSHAYRDFNADEPDHPERWGVALFPLDAAAERASVGEIARGASDRNDIEWDAQDDLGVAADGWSAPPSPPAPPAAEADDAPLPPGTLARMTRLGNGLKRVQTFRLDKPTDVRIVAVGEITGSNSYDFGLVRAESGTSSGTVVWEMRRGNTQPAGGHDRNRRFDGVVRLPAGTYTAEFRTDVSHAFGDFAAGDAPENAEEWGMVVRLAR